MGRPQTFSHISCLHSLRCLHASGVSTLVTLALVHSASDMRATSLSPSGYKAHPHSAVIEQSNVLTDTLLFVVLRGSTGGWKRGWVGSGCTDILVFPLAGWSFIPECVFVCLQPFLITENMWPRGCVLDCQRGRHRAVCGTNGRLYKSLCAFQRAQCINTQLRLAPRAHCSGTDTSSQPAS